MEQNTLALIMDDPDAMGAVGKVWVHWVVWNITSQTETTTVSLILSHREDHKCEGHDRFW